MSLAKIQQLVNSLTKAVDDNQKIATPILSVKLAKCIKEYPQDKTIGAISRIIEKMAENNNIFIRKSELKDLYGKHYSFNTKFAELFEDEIGAVQEAAPVVSMQHDDSLNVHSYEFSDPVLANALDSVFDNTIPLKMYSNSLAEKAKVTVANALDSWNMKPSSINISSGNEKFLIVQANYETPKGITSFYIPIEINANKIAEANVFMGNTGPQELNNVNVKRYLTSFAGAKLKVNGSQMLEVLTSAVSENREISDAEMALTRLNASRQSKSDFFQNQIVGQKISEASVQDVVLPKYDEFESFEKQFTSSYGQAAFQFGNDNVKIARENIARDLVSFGHNNAQVKVSGTDDNSIFYSVSLDSGKVAFTVPVKVNNGKLSKPTLMLCNGSIFSFDQKDINKLYSTNQTDKRAAATASASYGLKPSELINEIRLSVAEGNHLKAEDSLNVLASLGDEKAYASGFNAFIQALGGDSVVKTASTQCSMLVKNSTSEHQICGHTNLPIHKVYQDKHGNCQPLYRRGMSETYEGASFMNAKIFG